MEKRKVSQYEIDLINLMYNMKFEKEQAIGLLLLSSEENFTLELLNWLKEHPQATSEDAYEFTDSQY